MKKLILLIMGLFLVPVTANALCVSQVSQDALKTCVNLGAGNRCVNFADLQQTSKAKQAVQLADALQDIIDVRLPLSEMPTDWEDKFVDPAKGNFYWGDVDGVRHENTLLDIYQISRCAIVTAEWNGSQFVVTYTQAPRD